MTATVHPGLTTRQQQALDAIVAHQANHGHTPTFGELAATLSVNSKSGVSRLVRALEERGYIIRLAGRARSIALVDVERSPDDILSHTVRAKLEAYCHIKGGKPANVISDAVIFFLDEEEEKVPA